MRPAVRPTIIVRTRFTWPGENMLEGIHGSGVGDRTVTAFSDLFFRDGGLEKVSAADLCNEPQSQEDLVPGFLKHRHVAWMRTFENKIETRFKGTGGGLEMIADILQEGFEDSKSFALAFVNIVTQCDCPDEEPCAIVGEQKEHLRRLIEQLALRMGLQYPEMIACAVVRVIDRAIVRTLASGSLTEAQTARLLFQCLQHA